MKSNILKQRLRGNTIQEKDTKSKTAMVGERESISSKLVHLPSREDMNGRLLPGQPSFKN